MQGQENALAGAIELPRSKTERILEAIRWANMIAGMRFEPDEVRGPQRWADLVRVRHLATWRLRVVYEWSFPRIALEFGGRDHATIMHGVEKLNKEFGLPKNYPIEIWRAELAERLSKTEQHVQAMLDGASLEEVAFKARVPIFRLRDALRAAGYDVQALGLASRVKRDQEAAERARDTYAAELLAKAIENKRLRDQEEARRAVAVEQSLAVSFGL